MNINRTSLLEIMSEDTLREIRADLERIGIDATDENVSAMAGTIHFARIDLRNALISVRNAFLSLAKRNL